MSVVIEVVALSGGVVSFRAPCSNSTCLGYAEIITLSLPGLDEVPTEEGQYAATLRTVREGDTLCCQACGKRWSLGASK